MSLTGKRNDAAAIPDPSPSDARRRRSDPFFGRQRISLDASSGRHDAEKRHPTVTTQAKQDPAPARTSEAADSSRSSRHDVCDHVRLQPPSDPSDSSQPGQHGIPGSPKNWSGVWDWDDVWNRVKLITDLVGSGRPAPDDATTKMLPSGQLVTYTKDTACHSDPYALNPFYVNSAVKLPTRFEHRPLARGPNPIDIRRHLPPAFTGDIREFRKFRDEFISCVHQPGLDATDAQRMQLLRPLLQGPAATSGSIADGDIASNYHLVTATLAYNDDARPERVHHLLWKDMLAIPAATNCVAEFRTLYTKLLDVFRMMLDWDFDHRASHLDWYLQAKLPLAASMTILRKKSTLPDWDAFAFFDALEEMLDLYDEAVSLLGFGMPAASEGIPSRSGMAHRSTPLTDAFTEREPPLVKPSPRCSYCTTTTKNAHWSTQCPTFSTVRSRHKRAKALQLCYVCLRRGHKAGHLNCRAMLNRLCAYCQRQRHHKSLCSAYFSRAHGTTSGRQTHRDGPRRSRTRRAIPGPDANAEAFRKQSGQPPTGTMAEEQGRQPARNSTKEKVEASSTVRSEDRSTTSSTTPIRRTTGHQRSQAIRGAKDHEDPVKRPPSLIPPSNASVKSRRRNSAARRDGTSKQPMLERSVAKPAEGSVTRRRFHERSANHSVMRQTSTLARHAPQRHKPLTTKKGRPGADHDEDQKSPNWTEPRSSSDDDASLREGALATGRGPAASGNCPAHPLKCVRADVSIPAQGQPPTWTQALLRFDSGRRRSYISDRLARTLSQVQPSTSRSTAAAPSRACAPTAASVAAPGRTLRTSLTIQLAYGPAVTIPVTALPTDASSVQNADTDAGDPSEFRSGPPPPTPEEASPDVIIGRGHLALFRNITLAPPLPSGCHLAPRQTVNDLARRRHAELKPDFEARRARRPENEAVFCASIYVCEPASVFDGIPPQTIPVTTVALHAAPAAAQPPPNSNGIPCELESGSSNDAPSETLALTPVHASCLRSHAPADNSTRLLAALYNNALLLLPLFATGTMLRPPLGTTEHSLLRRVCQYATQLLGIPESCP